MALIDGGNVWFSEDRTRKLRCGDVVRLPDGTTGAVSMIEERVGGCRTVVSVRRFGSSKTAKRRWRFLPLFQRGARPVRFGDEEIERLELIMTRAEFDRIGQEECA